MTSGAACFREATEHAGLDATEADGKGTGGSGCS